MIKSHLPQKNKTPLAGVKNIIAIASGKGGVGKSTVAANLAVSLAKEGARVGLLDADIYGPSVPHMFGIDDSVRPEVKEGKYFVPIERYGVHTLSIGNLTTAKTPAIWRGPKASGALVQMVTQTIWPDLDYLLIDMPPGTGDIQLTLAQQIPVVGAVIVSTPQDIALLDAQKGIEMFNRVEIDVLGLIENMSFYNCTNCGQKEHLFGANGAMQLADEYKVACLGQLPLHREIREQGDIGQPIVAAQPDSDIATIYSAIAVELNKNVALKPLAPPVLPRVVTE